MPRGLILSLVMDVLVGSVCAQAIADVPLIRATPGAFTDSPELLGYSFEVPHPLTVTGLGKIDANANGLFDDLTAPRIGLWNTQTSELLASASIDGGAVFRDAMFVKSIDPVRLPPGNYTVAAEWFRDQEPYIFYRSCCSVPQYESRTLIDAIRPVTTRNTDFTMPTATARLLAFGPNLLIEKPPLLLTAPGSRAVTQRRDDGSGSIQFAGTIDEASVESVEVRAVPMGGSGPGVIEWQPVAVSGDQFSGAIDVPSGGWFQVEVRGLAGGALVEEFVVPKVGVGEVFVIAGQSNSANHGLSPLVPVEDRVSTGDARGKWRHGADPQPVASGSGGSPWPVLGDLLVQEYDVPVGFMSVGVGGTRVDQWLPDIFGTLYERLHNALELLGPDGARAVLWHQGESDAARGTTEAEYVERLQQIIERSRVDAGYEIPWGIARAAFLPQNSLEAEEAILAAQQQVIDGDPLVFAGPLTDDLLGPSVRYDAVHFNEAGLRLHAQRWFDALRTEFFVPEPVTMPLVACTLLAALAMRWRPGNVHGSRSRTVA